MLSEFSAALHDPELIAAHRLRPSAFTRHRTLTFPRIAAMMLSGLCASTQSELDRFFATLAGEPGRRREVSDRAFSQARRGFSARVFERLNTCLLEQMRTRLAVSTRQGAELTADHWAFALFLPGVELTLHASLHPIDGSERQMLFEVLDGLEPGRDLLVLDRGYPGNALLATLAQRGLAFCVRVDAVGWRCVSEFLRSGQSESIVTLGAPSASEGQTYEIDRQPTRVRLIRDLTPNGRVRVLMTNLLDPVAYSAKQFGALYHRRWRIEEAFKRLKHRLMLEAVSGLTYLALQQDFMAKVLADNLCAALARADYFL